MSIRRLGTVSLLAVWLWASPATSANQPEDAWITTKVKMNLLTAKEVDVLDINVDTFDGRVTLYGTVDSEAEETRAMSCAWSVRGVNDVRSLLVIVPEEERRVDVTDRVVERRVRAALARDEALADSEISVASVDGGVVRLEGRTGTLSTHLRALEDARRVDGVRGVVSEIRSPDELADLEIRAEGTPERASPMWRAAADAWITAKAKVRLIAEPGLSPMAINVDTRQGVTTLFGIVETDAIKAAAEASVKTVEGVQRIENELQVVPNVAAEKVEARDDAIRQSVEGRLATREAVTDSHIRVDVKSGAVRLTGTVASQRDRLTALTLARSAAGAQSVIDELGVSRARN